ncbi:PCNA-interacting partner-like isoform X2 [Actinia tenebrosa]|nr:PCNA-interacting partner-like isoform X2 [Actinia tenebrosa]
MGDVLNSTRSTYGNPNEFLGQCEEHSLLHPLELCVEIYRKHCSKSPPFCNSIYGLTDQLISLQIVMAQKNKEKSGEFEADTLDVISTHQQLIESKLYGLSSVKDPEILQIIEDYGKFLADCNAMDYADIINCVSQCFQASDNNTKELYQNQQYIILGIPTTVFEMEILQLLIGARNIVLLSPNQGKSTITSDKFNEIIKDRFDANKHMEEVVPRTQESVMPSTPVHVTKKQTCQVTPQHQTGTNDRQGSVCLSGGQSPILSQSPFSQGRRTMGQELSVVMSYLQLLLNSRDELALARVINTPDRELGVRKFTKIKRLAREKNMSMYQMVTSFILQIRLGGKSYAPSTENPLWLMTKGLGDFVSFFQKLQNILEEEPDAKSAVTKILWNLQSTFIRGTDGTISKEDVKKAISYLKTQIDGVLNSSAKKHTDELKPEPDKNMIGSESYLLLCTLLDKNVLYDYQEKELSIALKTPSRKQGTTCSLLTKFRSPDAPTPEKVESPGANQNRTTENPEHRKRQGRSVYGDISWANPAVTIETRKSIWQNNDDNNINQEQQTRKPCGMLTTGETPKSSSRKRTFDDTCDTLKDKSSSPLRKRPFESKDDQENIINKQTKPTAKRGLLRMHQMTEPGKKKPQRTNTVPKKKQKSVKLTQGQKQMTHFFR